MIIFPAIDIKNGKVVRLLQGRFDDVTEYSQNPLDVAKQWEKLGAQWLHIVDLDGAQEGKMKNSDIILEIAKSVNIPVQVGGGIRATDTIEQLIQGGISRVILGTKAIENLEFLENSLFAWKDKLAISLDCNKGMVAQRGWTETSDIKATEFVKELERLGVNCLIYTDIARDGMLTGPNIKELEELCAATKIPIIASGGVASLADIKALLKLEDKGIIGVITGKAIYEKKFQLQDALNLC